MLVDPKRAGDKSLEGLKVALQLAEMQLEVFTKFTAPKKMKALKGAVDTAALQILLVRQRSEAELQAAKASLAAQNAAAVAELSRLDRWQHDLSKCKIVAPHDGVVAVAGRQVVAGAEVRAWAGRDGTDS